MPLKPIARVGDPIGHSGTPTGSIIGPGNPTVQSPAGSTVSVIGDTVFCSVHPSVSPNVIEDRPGTVLTFAGAKKIARVDDTTTCGASILIGNPTVLVGD